MTDFRFRTNAAPKTDLSLTDRDMTLVLVASAHYAAAALMGSAAPGKFATEAARACLQSEYPATPDWSTPYFQHRLQTTFQRMTSTKAAAFVRKFQNAKRAARKSA